MSDIFPDKATETRSPCFLNGSCTSLDMRRRYTPVQPMCSSVLFYFDHRKSRSDISYVTIQVFDYQIFAF